MPILVDNTVDNTDPDRQFVIVCNPVCSHCDKSLKDKDYLMVEITTGKAFCDNVCIKEYKVKQVISKL